GCLATCYYLKVRLYDQRSRPATLRGIPYHTFISKGCVKAAVSIVPHRYTSISKTQIACCDYFAVRSNVNGRDVSTSALVACIMCINDTIIAECAVRTPIHIEPAQTLIVITIYAYIASHDYFAITLY